MLSKTLEQLYLSYVNDYLTIEAFAEGHNIDPHDADVLIKIARRLYEKAYSYNSNELPSDVADIIIRICMFFMVSVEDVLSDSRKKEIVFVRHIIIAYLRMVNNYKAVDIGDMLNRYYPNILTTVSKFIDRMEMDSRYRNTVKKMCEHMGDLDAYDSLTANETVIEVSGSIQSKMRLFTALRSYECDIVRRANTTELIFTHKNKALDALERANKLLTTEEKETPPMYRKGVSLTYCNAVAKILK